MDQIHHVAVSVGDVAAAVNWYRRNFRCGVDYQDETWAQLAFANCKLALVTNGQHPAHFGIEGPDPGHFGTVQAHRDGIPFAYLTDPFGNWVEVVGRVKGEGGIATPARTGSEFPPGSER